MVAKARFFESVAAENPDVRVHNVHPGAVDTEMGKKAADGGMKLPQDDGLFSLSPTSPFGPTTADCFETVELPAHFIAWILSGEAAFLRSRMVWANWDVEELKEMEGKIAEDPALLNMGMNGWPYSPLV
jgi:NAD(P)-dependent dehydrogenase (short-subunit alcohol dehydrogenase family)